MTNEERYREAALNSSGEFDAATDNLSRSSFDVSRALWSIAAELAKANAIKAGPTDEQLEERISAVFRASYERDS